MRTGGQRLVDQLVAQGVDVVFGVPGESYIAVLDALLDAPVRYVTCRHEAAAANMAEAYGKLRGRPGVCMVTRGPGATHAACGIHTADHDSTPLVVLVGQAPRSLLGRHAFQELDYPSVFGSLTKWTAQVEAADDVAESVAQAFSVASAGRPGPVVLAFPEDVLVETTTSATVAPAKDARPRPSEDELTALRALLATAERPLVIVGEGGWRASASDDVLAFARANALPVAASFRCQDYVDNHADAYCGPLTLGGDPRLADRVREADLILALGGRLGEITTQAYALLAAPRPSQTLVHVHPDPSELGSVVEPALGIVSALPEAAAALRALSPVTPRWEAWTAGARADYVDNLRHRLLPGAVDMGAVMEHLRDRLPDDAILTSGAGNFTVWAHRFYEFRRYGTQLAPTSGAMGYGVPAAIAASIVRPGSVVVCIAGDGDFLMSAQELATAVQEHAPIVVVVVDNGMLGTIRMHQERHYPGRVSGTDLRSPDFAAIARAYGGHGERVERTDGFGPALERALASGLPAVVHVLADPEAITPRQTLSEIRAGAEADRA
jgi:acetolactate synthase-1/2/3 large subunit